MLPIIYQSHDLILYSYPLFMGLGWGIAYQVYTNNLPMNFNLRKAQFLFWALFVVSWIGAKALFYITLPPQLSNELLTQISFWTGGGFVFYGGLLAGLIFLVLLRLFGMKLTAHELWPILPALTLGHAVGRLGCFLAGCCYGIETNWIWAIHSHGADRHPTQLIEALGLLCLGIYLLKSKKSKAFLLSSYFFLYGALRFVVEILRGDEIRGLWAGLTPSQWISVAMVLLGLSLWSRLKVSKT